MKIDLKNIKLSTESLIKLTSIIDKMGISNSLKGLDKPTNEELGTEILVLFMTNLYKAENEVYDFVISYLNLFEEPIVDQTIENYDEVYQKKYENNYKKALEKAKKENFIDIVKKLLQITGMSDFLEQQ